MDILVYGFYGSHLNRGDELFKEAFKHLFSQHNFSFTDHLTSNLINKADAIFFGGGSLLFGKPQIDSVRTLQLLMQKPIFYIGVGVEEEIHPDHIGLLQSAKLVATRSIDQVDRLKQLNVNTMWIPDLVFALKPLITNTGGKISKSILINTNVYVLPKSSEPQWKHAAWTYFKSEFAQFLDYLLEEKFNISFLPLCTNNKEHDNWTAYELISYMERGNNKFILPEASFNFSDIVSLYSKYEMVISQRYHGMILAELVNTPFLGICHHDKLKTHQLVSADAGEFVSFYNCSKRLLIDTFDKLIIKNIPNNDTKSAIFDALKEEVNNLLY